MIFKYGQMTKKKWQSSADLGEFYPHIIVAVLNTNSTSLKNVRITKACG